VPDPAASEASVGVKTLLPIANTSASREPLHRSRRIVFDGANLSGERATGIATYTRALTRVARDIGYDVGVIYTTPFTPPDEPLLREIAFFDEKREQNQLGTRQTPRRMLNYLIDQARYHFSISPMPFTPGGTVMAEEFSDELPEQNYGFTSRNLYKNAWDFFGRTKNFVELKFGPLPQFSHWTCPLPLRAWATCNIYTIHDLALLRLPFAATDNKRQTYRMLKKIALEADHIVTVSETARCDIIELLGVAPDQITNTYQAVYLPEPYIARSQDCVANYLEGALGVSPNGYLLFFGSVAPKNNVGRLIEGYFRSGAAIPLILATSPGWGNEAELALIERHRAVVPGKAQSGPGLRCLEDVGLSTLVTLIRGARAVVFPSLYEGFGLPVLKAMMLGTPVVTARAGALPEIAGDAAVLVDPYDVDDIAKAIKIVVDDRDLRRELSKRGIAQAGQFSIERYRERLRTLYAGLG
jgi:glycosyltransferase involved in cell wall biosynthesis